MQRQEKGLLKKQWQLNKFVFCHITAFLLLAIWAYPSMHNYLLSIDAHIFQSLNGTLYLNKGWAFFLGTY
ncbi:hypothetical protein GKC56_08250 [Neisseriaceae bacterium PsAf]|nr:hypothetical protein [Neisseriaceae bacterium PsAf]